MSQLSSAAAGELVPGGLRGASAWRRGCWFSQDWSHCARFSSPGHIIPTSMRRPIQTCGLNQNVPIDDFTHALANGASFSGLALAGMVYAGIPLAFALVGIRLLYSRQPVRVWGRLLLILSAVLFLGAVFILEIGFGLQYFGNPIVTADGSAVEWVALVALVAVVLAGVLLPGRRQMRS